MRTPITKPSFPLGQRKPKKKKRLLIKKEKRKKGKRKEVTRTREVKINRIK